MQMASRNNMIHLILPTCSVAVTVSFCAPVPLPKQLHDSMPLRAGPTTPAMPRISPPFHAPAMMPMTNVP
jgi:hypothetical protein